MNKLLKTLAPVILTFFIFTVALPLRAEAFWPLPDNVKAEDNEHVTYQINNEEHFMLSGIWADDTFDMSISVFYDGAPIKEIKLVNASELEVIHQHYSEGWNFITYTYRLKAPSQKGNFNISFEGSNNGKLFSFSVPITINEKGYMHPLMSTMLIIGVIAGVGVLASAFK